MLDKIKEWYRLSAYENHSTAKHIIAGFVSGLIGAYLFGAVFGFFLSGGLGLAKEVYDRYNDGVVDFFDLFWTWLSGIVGIMAVGAFFGSKGIYNIAFSEVSFFAVLAVYGAVIYWLFKR